MKARYLFLLKFLGLSLLLFIFGHQLLQAYAYVMALGMKLLSPNYHITPARAEEFLYGSSMTIIAFFALILATPNIPLPKRGAALVVGLIAFFLTDWLFIQYLISGQSSTGLPVGECCRFGILMNCGEQIIRARRLSDGIPYCVDTKISEACTECWS